MSISVKDLNKIGESVSRTKPRKESKMKGNEFSISPRKILNLLIFLRLKLYGFAFGSGNWKGTDGVTVTEAMTHVPFFSDLTDQERELVRPLCSVREGPAGDRLMIEGAPVQHILFLLSGKVEIYKKDKDGQEKLIASLGPGFFYGELSFLDHGPASATVKAGLPYQAVAIDQEALQRLLDSQPRLGYKIIRVLARLTSLRLREADDMLVGFPGALRDLTIARARYAMPSRERKSI